MNNRKILITGGAGFIGSALIRYIIAETSDSVVNVDKLTYAGNLESLKSIENNPRYTFERVDICDGGELKRVFTQYEPDLVIHLAAESHVDRSIDSPRDFLETNVMGTYQLLEAANIYWRNLIDSHKKSSFRFQHVSTDEVYGDLTSPDDFFTESTPYAPSSPYSASKAASDHLVRAWQRTYKLPTVITNCSNNYGPYHFPEKLIPVTIVNALNGKNIPIYGKGDQIRDWLFVEDHARALYVVSTTGETGETYNIGGHNEKTNLDVVNEICKIMDNILPAADNDNIVAPLKSYADLISFVQDRPGHDKRYAIDATKIGQKLDWHPANTFEQGIENTVKWFLDNQLWWKRILSGEYLINRENSGDNF